MSSGDFSPGTFVLVWNNPLDFQFANKGALHWQGPYIVVQRQPKGAYVLAELDGIVLAKPFAARRLKLYHYRDIKKPIIRIEWRDRAQEHHGPLDDGEPDDSDDISDYEVSRVTLRKMAKTREGPKLPRPWELRGKNVTNIGKRYTTIGSPAKPRNVCLEMSSPIGNER